MKQLKLRIHGDNVVECERTLALLVDAFRPALKKVSFLTGSAVCPSFTIELNSPPNLIEVVFLPGFGRWDQNILAWAKSRGAVLREAADSIISRVDDGFETPIFAIEYCGALPAGNQAWQRNGRAYAFGLAGIPYLYIAELGGYELAANRTRKAARMPNPAVPFSYLAHSEQRGTPVLPIMVTSPGADASSRTAYQKVFSDEQLAELIRSLVLNEDPSAILATIERRVFEFIKVRAGAMRGGETISPAQWQGAYDAILAGTSLPDYLLKNVATTWSKTAYIAGLTATARRLMDAGRGLAVGLTSTKLPMCLIPGKSRRRFAAEVSKIYPDLPAEFIAWLKQDSHLAICWVMGFKPRGDDARPDRGLPPLTRMLIGESTEMLCVVYGPAPASTWPVLLSNPLALARSNGLWEAILATSDALLVDSATHTLPNRGFLKTHWASVLEKEEMLPILVTPLPNRTGEQDVDTAIHLLFKYFADSNVFEGMCNPPGGDWSGISLLSPDKTIELRWLSLPRVSSTQAKRPDHVFQFFGIMKRPIMLAIESKETAIAVEPDVGPRLTRYVADLIAVGASIERDSPQKLWSHSIHQLPANCFEYASAAAFIPTDVRQMAEVGKRTNTDIVIGTTFNPTSGACQMVLLPRTDVGTQLAAFIQTLTSETISITVI